MIDKITGCKKQRQIHQKLGTSSSAIRTLSRLEVGLGRTSKACLRAHLHPFPVVHSWLLLILEISTF
ncbi:hypothetical protein FH630_05380 [Lactiplantibacillus plantarum]|nr:hypothetical protein [Lactiplantibacillus plantarum]